MAIDYEQIRQTINAVWCKGVYSDVSSTPTNQMLVPGKGPMPLRLVVEYYKTYCKEHNIVPAALQKPKATAVNPFNNLFED